MTYALIENGTVVNLIWLSPKNAAEFQTAVQSDLAAIGDEYKDGRFYRDNQPVKTQEERYTDMLQELQDAKEALAILDVAQEEVQDNA